jgi:hypothetical protein
MGYIAEPEFRVRAVGRTKGSVGQETDLSEICLFGGTNGFDRTPLTISPNAAWNPPWSNHENATRHSGRYGAVIVMTPNKDILMDGFRRDQMYTSAKARLEDRNGRVRSGEMSWAGSGLRQHGPLSNSLYICASIDVDVDADV